MKLARFIIENKPQIVSDWEEFARTCLPEGTVAERRDHVEGMLDAISLDLQTSQTKATQEQKSKGTEDAHVSEATAANAHGTDRAASGYSPAQMVSEFRALRASVLRHFAEATAQIDRAGLEEVTRFNEAIDQALSESMATYAEGIERSKDLVLGVLGHDLRNPLGAIMMATTVMLTHEGPGWLHAKTAARILTSTTRMDEMIRDLLDFTRSRLGGGIPMVRADTNLETICRNTIDEIIAFRPKTRVTLVASGELQGQWDRSRLAQMLSNLIGNAYQHGAKNTPIEVTLRGERDVVVLAIHNKGSAIAKDKLKEIFDPFRQLAPGSGANPSGSIGLGLYIAQAIAIAHGGTITVEATTDGNTFSVRLPRAASNQRPKPGATRDAQ